MGGGEGRCGGGGGGGNGLSSNSVCMANGLIYKGYTLQRYSDIKNHKFLFSGTRVKYLKHDGRVCIVCISQYIRFGRIAYLRKPRIIVYFGVSRGTRCIKVVWSLLQHSYFVYGRYKAIARPHADGRRTNISCADQFIVQHTAADS